MGTTMLAGRMNFATGTFAVTQVPVPVPGPGEVRVRVRAAGICLSDVHGIEGLLGRPALLNGGDELTLGHEVAGEVESLGDGVTGVEIGARVIVVGGTPLSDGRYWLLGVNTDGGWAEHVVVPADVLVPMPDSLTFEQAAIIPDAVSTPWGAIESTGQLKPGETAAVWGIGGLGVHAVQLLRFAGAAPIIAVDPIEAARQRALDFGADIALDPADPGFAQAVRAATGGNGVDVAFDFAGVAPVRTQALDSLRVGGRLVLVGVSGNGITIENDIMFHTGRRQILGHFGSATRHTIDLVRFTRLGRLDLSRSISGTLPLADAAKGVEQLASKAGNPIRLVLLP
jgi:threonine dehydrogenase-like Zn-dependent dehydrogenase